MALERDDISVACEISVSTDIDHEIGNIGKCLAAGFDHVVMISGNKTVLNKGRAQAKSVIGAPDFARVQFFTFEELNAFLETLNADAASTVKTVRGYKVKTSYKTLSESEKKARKKVIAETIITALRKNKDNA